MATGRRRGLGVLVHLLLIALLFGSFDLSLAQQSEGGVPFFNDSGSLNLPPASNEELQESMPELQLFPSPNPAEMMPELGDGAPSPGP